MTIEEKLTEEVRILTEIVRALAQRVSELEASLAEKK
jgi:hypothetical protein